MFLHANAQKASLCPQMSEEAVGGWA